MGIGFNGVVTNEAMLCRLRNRAIPKVRGGGVELPFAILKHWMGYVRCRFRGLEKNGTYHFLLVAGYNLKREVETYA
ncbi:MAG: transposase [Candidatus Hydrogenedens sp.]|nr:transposase [Candidatus Hydrogenedens sp.]